MSAFDEQIAGNHYKLMMIQPTEYILANNLGWCEANVVKYISRWRSKGGVDDLRKVIHYAQILIEKEMAPKDKPKGPEVLKATPFEPSPWLHQSSSNNVAE